MRELLKTTKYYIKHLTRWIESSAWFDTNQRVCKTLFLEYKEYLVYEKKYATTTVNVRLRPVKHILTGC